MGSISPLGINNPLLFGQTPPPVIAPPVVQQPTVLTAAPPPAISNTQPILQQIMSMLMSLLQQLGGGGFNGALGATPPPAAATPKPVPLADVAKGFDTLQNGKPIDPKVLADAAGADGILTQAEAAKLDGVTCINKKTGEELDIAACMKKNGVTSIDVASGVNTAIADVAKGFDTLQDGKPIDPKVLAKAAGADGILTQAEAATLDGVVCVNKETGEELDIAACMKKNGVFAINLGIAADAEANPADADEGDGDGGDGDGGGDGNCDEA